MIPPKDIHQLTVDTIRYLSADAVQEANSGHPGTPMSTAAMATVLWTRFLRFNPANPGWPGRDRFVLSAGHASMLLYSLLHLTGYDLPLEEIRRFRQWGSKTPGHHEFGHTPGVEETTGPPGPGDRQRRGNGHGREAPGRRVQPSRARGRRSPGLCPVLGRRSAGGGVGRGGQPGRTHGPGSTDLPLRRQPDPDRGTHGPVLHRGRGRPGSRPGCRWRPGPPWAGNVGWAMRGSWSGSTALAPALRGARSCRSTGSAWTTWP